MQKRALGRTGLEVSALGLGGIKFPGVDQDQVNRIVNGAIDRGVNLIDSARGYGDSEERIGRALAGRRDEVLLCTKGFSRDADGMRRDIETSLKMLKTDHIDIYLIHNLRLAENYDTAVGPGGAVEALERARDEGLVRHVGLSCHRYHDTFERAITSGRFDVGMMAYNVLNDEMMDERIMPLAKEHNMGTLVMKPLGGGVLGQGPPSVKLPDGARVISAGDAIRFVLANRDVDCCVVGMARMSDLAEDVAAAESSADLTDEQIKSLQEWAESLGKGACRACGYCQPCPNGILIPVILRHLFYAKTYGLTDWARVRYSMVEIKADQCKRCGECIDKCPYDLPVPDLLEEAHEMLS